MKRTGIASLIAVTLLIFANSERVAGQCFQDDFNSGVSALKWPIVQNGIASTGCGSISGNALYMGGGSAGQPRSATTTGIDVSLGGFIEFDLIIGSQPWPSNCELADSATNESVWLLSSITGGISWDTIGFYGAQTIYSNWTHITLPIPPVSFSPATVFRWIQFYSDGLGQDQWSIDDVKVTCILPTDPPISFLTADPTFTCYGNVDFFNQSVGLVDTSIWCYGDGNCDTVLGAADISYVYTTSGLFNVTLSTINANGRHDTTINSMINVSLGGGPPAMPCTPSTSGTCCGAGIYNVTFGTINNSTGDAQSEGYVDETCTQLTDVFAGTDEPITIQTNNSGVDMVRVWVDWNADTVFDPVTELAFQSDSVVQWHTGFVDVPDYPAMNTPIRMRVANAPYGLYNNIPTCDTILYGQYEDYGVIVRPNPSAPDANFYSWDTLTCDGEVSFFDLSQNVPTSWFWDFGDSQTDTAKNPTHEYLNPGTYTVTLISTNGVGSDTAIRTLFVQYDIGTTPRDPDCIPNTLFANCLQYGIYRFELGNIDVSSDCGDEGYVDFTCLARDTLTEAIPYTFKMKTNPSLPQDTWMWLDMDNDGVFEFDDELIVEVTNEIDAQGIFNIPHAEMDSLAYDIPLRLRVGSDFTGAGLNPCSNPSFGQFEDYTIVVERNTNPPVAWFTSENTTVCPGTPVYFIDSSEHVVETWNWDLGDGNFSSHQNPVHYYANPGTYAVVLTVCNDFGCDTITKFNYVSVNNQCEYNIGVEGDITSCEGIIYDDGGPAGNYGNSKDLATWINAPCPDQTLTLTFSSMNLSSLDSLIIYDGDDLSATRTIYTNTTTTPPPFVASTGTFIMRQKTNNFTNSAGFAAQWACSGPPCAEFTFNPSLSDQCIEEYKYINLSSLQTTNSWNFGDGSTSAAEHPAHTFTTHWSDSLYYVTLVVTNANGADTLTKGLRRYKIDPGWTNSSAPKDIFIGQPPYGFVTFYDTSNYWINKWEWRLGEGTKSRIKNPSHTYDSIGLYTICLEVSNGVCETNFCKLQWVRINDGVASVVTENAVSVYPNPSEGQLNVYVKMDQPTDMTLRLFNVMGQQVYTERFEKALHLDRPLNVSNLEKGVYIVRIRAEGVPEELVQKIIIQ